MFCFSLNICSVFYLLVDNVHNQVKFLTATLNDHSIGQIALENPGTIMLNLDSCVIWN